jgi:antagonist of KipI
VSVEVLRPGLLTTIQDRGRFGCAMLGVGRAGAMDDVALRLANALVGNGPDAAALEVSLVGPRLRFEASTTIALTGAEFVTRIDDAELPMWRPVAVDAGAVLDIGSARRGARAYLAIAGGIDAPRTLGSAATDVNAKLGGRPLREGDRLACEPPERRDSTTSSGRSGAWSLDPRPWFDGDGTTPIRLMPGAHFDALDAPSRAALFEAEFRVGRDSNRVGYRLDGPNDRLRLAFDAPLELVSEPLAAGTLQLPPGGEPIVLMAEHPTIGGYPRIGQVAAVDLPRLAQRRPGDPVRFAAIDLDTAQTRYLERERELTRLIDAIHARLAP